MCRVDSALNAPALHLLYLPIVNMFLKYSG